MSFVFCFGVRTVDDDFVLLPTWELRNVQRFHRLLSVPQRRRGLGVGRLARRDAGDERSFADTSKRFRQQPRQLGITVRDMPFVAGEGVDDTPVMTSSCWNLAPAVVSIHVVQHACLPTL